MDFYTFIVFFICFIMIILPQSFPFLKEKQVTNLLALFYLLSKEQFHTNFPMNQFYMSKKLLLSQECF